MGFSLAEARDRARITANAPARVRGLVAIGIVALAVVLLQVYERLSLTASITADSANVVLQGRSMADGNLLLRDWTLSGASFYATDLPLYAVVSVFRGLSVAAAHDVGAVIYTLVVIAAAYLARGEARGTEAAWRMLITLTLLVAPLPGEAAQLLLLGPFHAGTTLVVVLALLVIDAYGDHALGIVSFGLVLALAVLSDALALYVAVFPLVIVSCLRLVGSRRPAGSELWTLTAALLAVPAALLGMALIRGLGGFATIPLDASFVRIEELPKNIGLTVQGVLLLFGANFFGQPLTTPRTLIILVHLLGIGFVVYVFRRMVRGWRKGGEPDRIVQVLLVAMALDLAAYLFSNQAIDLLTSRYLIPFLVFGAVLAGRAGADLLQTQRLRVAAGIVAFAYAVSLLVVLQTPPAPTPESEVGSWLERNGLRYGLAAYWQASTVTVATGGRVRVRAVGAGDSTVSPYRWEAQDSWYDPSVPGNQAMFVLRDTTDSRSVDRRQVEAAFGPAEEDHRIGRYEVLVWHRNLLRSLSSS